MINPVGHGFEAPESPNPHERDLSASEHANTPHLIGQKLYENAQEFYAWHMSRDSHPLDNAITYQSLSHLMQIAKISHEGGEFLTPEEENTVVSKINDISSALASGTMRQSEIPHALEQSLTHLVENCPKAKLIYSMMKIEHYVYFESQGSYSDSTKASLSSIANRVFAKITPELQNFEATSMSRNLELLLDSPPHDNDLTTHLEKILDTIIN